jgi:glycosyltransferase involved in cell wall biosynthesis
VAEAVESALAQTVPAVEVVVCNDGSTDGTEEALGPYRDRIDYLWQENGGEGAAKNAAAGRASGDFLVFLDADDVFLPERLEALGELAVARPDLDVLVTDAFLELNGTPLRRCYDASWPFPVTDQRAEILGRNFVLGHAAVRHSVFLAHGGFDETIPCATDWDLWLRIVHGGAGVGLVTEPLSRYRVTPGSLSSSQERLLEGHVRVLEKAVASGQLDTKERERVLRSLANDRARLLLARAKRSLLAGQPSARSLCFAVARDSRQTPASRLKSILAAVAPPVAGRLLLREQVETTAGLLVPASELRS